MAEQLKNQDGTNVPVPDKGEAEKVSTPEVQPSKQVWETSEFQKAVETHAFRIAQSMTDKMVKPLKEKLDAFEKKEKEKATEESLNSEMKKFIEDEGIPEANVRKFEDAVKEHVSKAQSHNSKVKEHEAKVQEFETTRKSMELENSMYKTILPEADAILKESIESILKEADSPQSQKLMIEKLRADLRTKLVESLTKPREPNIPSGAPSAPGGGSDEAIRDAFIKDPYDPKNQEAYLKKSKKK